MATSLPLSLLLLLLLLLPSSSAQPPRNLRPQFVSDSLSTQSGATPTPTRYFEVTKPLTKPSEKPCSLLALRHDFGFTYGKPPVTALYAPPASCGDASEFSRIVLEWSAASKGRQFDRIFGVWLGGVELLRSCTAEPRKTGIVWTVQKDVSRYHSLLTRKHNQTLSVYLGNLIDDTYTGVYHVNVSFHYYPALRRGKNGKSKKWADLLLPVSRNLPLKDGLWFEVQGSHDSSGFKDLTIPRNAYRALLEVYVSFHENDEFWYGNFPNVYNEANNITAPGNGPFREVLVSLDGVVVGAVWPFTVIFTGGINPLLWRPITAIGSFDLPSYDVEITPSLGKILDGKSHRIGFRVTNALNVWYVNANLHLWLDEKLAVTEGALTEHLTPPPTVSLAADFTGFDGTFQTRVGRTVSSVGWVKSSHGNRTARYWQSLYYSNEMVVGNKGNKQTVEQATYGNESVAVGGEWWGRKKKFWVGMESDAVERGKGETVYVSKVRVGVAERRGGPGKREEVWNEQKGEGKMVVKGNLVQSGVASLEQVYDYAEPGFRYARNISASNYTILYDHVLQQFNNRHFFSGLR